MKRFSDLPDIVLGPLAGRPDADWYRAPEGRWNSAQIVEHLALGLDLSATTFERRRAHDPMVRRPLVWREKVSKLFVMHLGVFLPRRQAPPMTVPPPQVERTAAEVHFRRGVERFEAIARLLLPSRAYDLFAKHPRMGDLTLPEWMEFHLRHARHHARQIRRRLAS